jgi:S-adenosylmethionine hydrolase
MLDRPIITLTTDFGYDDSFAGVMKGVILKINPRAEIVDITHGVAPHDIREAAYTIGTTYRFFPDDTVHVVVVDPGVGSQRRPLLVLTDHHYFIGPDNGVFSHIYSATHDVLEVVHITADHYFLSSHSPTFQGRDVFAPVAAYLSRGVGMLKFGEQITDYQKIELPVPFVTREGVLQGEVIHIDRFGNAITNVTKADMEKVGGTGTGTVKVLFGESELPLKKFYSDAAAGSLCCLWNSSGYLELFTDRGSAAAKYNISLGDAVGILHGGQ